MSEHVRNLYAGPPRWVRTAGAGQGAAQLHDWYIFFWLLPLERHILAGKAAASGPLSLLPRPVQPAAGAGGILQMQRISIFQKIGV